MHLANIDLAVFGLKRLSSTPLNYFDVTADRCRYLQWSWQVRPLDWPSTKQLNGATWIASPGWCGTWGESCWNGYFVWAAIFSSGTRWAAWCRWRHDCLPPRRLRSPDSTSTGKRCDCRRRFSTDGRPFADDLIWAAWWLQFSVCERDRLDRAPMNIRRTDPLPKPLKFRTRDKVLQSSNRLFECQKNCQNLREQQQVKKMKT